MTTRLTTGGSGASTNGLSSTSGNVGTRRDSAFGQSATSVTGQTFFPLLKDPASLANEKERSYYQKEEEKIFQTVGQMEKCQLVTDQMLSILDSFDDKLSALESSMLPIHKGTSALTTAQKNIDSTLRETDKIILHYSIATESEDSINSHLINSIDYVSYLEWVEKIHLSINFFAKNRERLSGGSSGLGGKDTDHGVSSSSSSSGSSGGGVHSSSDFEKYLKKLKDLNKRVLADCEHEFERVLGQHSKNPLDLSRTGWPLPATMLSEDRSRLIPYQFVPELSVRELGQLATRMACAGCQTYYGILLSQRSGFLKASLKKIFHEEVRFVVNTLQQQQQQLSGTGGGGVDGKPGLNHISSYSYQAHMNQPPPLQVMHLRGSIIHHSSAAGGGSTIQPYGRELPSASIAGYGSGTYDLPNTPHSGASTAATTVIPNTLPTAGGGGGAPQLYLKNTHKSVFYLEFFLKLLELENIFLLQLLSHIFTPEERAMNGLPAIDQKTLAAREESMLSGATTSSSSTLGGSTSSGSSGGSSAGERTAGSGKASSGSTTSSAARDATALITSALTTSTTTGSLTVFWGQEAYDQIFAHIVEVPLEYFKKKIEQATYLKDSSLKLANVLSNVLSGGSSSTNSSSGSGALGKSLLPGNSSGSGANTSSSSSSGSSSSDHPGHMLSNKILILLDVLDHLDSLLPRYRLALRKHSQFEKMSELQQQVTTLARKSIQEYREYILSYSEPQRKGLASGKVGKDGTIYTLTVETLNFIRRLYEYRRVIEHTTTLVDKHHAGQAAQAEKEAREREMQELNERFGVTGGSGTGGDKSDKPFTQPTPEDTSPLTRLVSFLLSGLEANMDAKAKAYKLPSLSAIFLLNNFHYASRFLRKYEGIFLTQNSTGNLQSTVERYDKLVHTTMKQYRTVSWEKIVNNALEVSDLVDLYRAYNSAAPGSSNHKAARKAIKQKFQFFNTTFDELYHTQRYFSIPDSDLRSQLRNDNVELIMQGYKQLYEMFSSVNFSNTPAKYMKYRPDTVESLLNRFFDETTT